ncbi:MAG: oligosaccharide flippase family protein [Candidatus Limnocylindrales bacterium]
MTPNAALLLGARLISALTTLAVLSLVARLRGPDALGLVALGFAAGAILAVLTEIGFGGFLVREAARQPDLAGQLLGGMLAVRLVTVPVVLGLAWIAMRAVSSANAAVVWLAAAGLVFQQWADLSRAVSLSRGRIGVLAAHAITENVAWLAVIAALLLSGASVATALAGGLLACAVSVVGGLLLIRIKVGVRPALPGADLARRLLRDAAPFAVFALLGTASTRIDTVLVAFLVPGSAIVAAGAYFAATRLVAAFEYLPEALSRSLLPDLSRLYVVDPAALGALLQRPSRFLLFVGIPIPFAMVVFGPWLMELLFGQQLGSYGWVLIGLSALVPFRFFTWLFGATLTSTDAQWRRVAAAAVALTVVAAIDALLLPRFGIAAAVAGAAGATLIVVGVYAYGVARLVGPMALLTDAGLALVAAAVALAAGLAVGAIAATPVAAVVFAAVYLLAIAFMVRLPRGRRPLPDQVRG